MMMNKMTTYLYVAVFISFDSDNFELIGSGILLFLFDIIDWGGFLLLEINYKL